MNLDETQRKKVAAWIDEGLKLAEIQKRLESECGLKLTYLEVRLLVDDLKLQPKDPPPPPPPKAATPSGSTLKTTPVDELGAGNVSVSVDQLTRPGAMVSGKVTFSDGKTADWFLDQTGRLGLAPADKGYKPSQVDLEDFQMALQKELQKLGL